MTKILLFLAFLLFGAGCLIPKTKQSGRETVSLSDTKWEAKGLGLLVAVVATIWASYYQVPAGYQGILIQQGAVSGSLGAGPHFVTPYLQSVELMEIRTQKEEAQAAAASKDLQSVSTQVAINYHVDPAAAQVLYKQVGPDFSKRKIGRAHV